LDNLEICHRIAEIEGVHCKITEEITSRRDVFWERHQQGLVNFVKIPSFEDLYNPITNDALCFELMVKYAIKVSPRIGNTTATWTGGNIESTGDKHTNKAICLAILEAFNRI